MPTTNYQNVELSFTSIDDIRTTANVASDGTYTVDLVPGDYEIYFEENLIYLQSFYHIFGNFRQSPQL